MSEDPGWTEGWHDWRGDEVGAPFTDVGHAIPPISEALAAWSVLESADIRWEVVGMEEGLVDNRDGRHTVTVDPTTSAGAIAITWRSRESRNNRWYVTECDVVLSPWGAANLAQDRLSTLIHEFGHCIGLHHAAVAPHSYHAWIRDTQVSVWGPSPQMSYGPEAGNELHLDDIIGASLLRPVPGWLPTRGTVSGSVTVAGETAPHVPVWALHVSGSGTETSVGGFTNLSGHFVIEGLAPGDYLVRAGPMLATLAHFDLSGDPLVDVNDGFALNLVTVFPGIVTDGITLDLLPSRGGSARARSGRGVPLASGPPGDTPCPGVRTWASSTVVDVSGRSLATTVTIERSPNAAETTLDLLGPYVEWREGSTDPPISATRIGVWRAERTGQLVRHEFGVEWADAAEEPDSDLRIGFRGEGCSGSPVVACSIAGCRLIP